MKKTYDDMIDMPHHVSDRHPQMPMAERAAQSHRLPRFQVTAM